MKALKFSAHKNYHKQNKKSADILGRTLATCMTKGQFPVYVAIKRLKGKNGQRTWIGHRKGNSFAFKHEKILSLFNKKSKTTGKYNM